MEAGKMIRRSVQLVLAATALAVVQPALANTIELHNFWAGSGAVKLKYSGTAWYSGQSVSNYSVAGGSGGFTTYDLTNDPGRNNPFQTFCVDIFHDFNFVVDSVDASPTATPAGLGSAALLNLGRLYTLYGSLIASHSSSGLYEAAFQDAIWAIVNDGSVINSAGVFNLSSGQPLVLTPYSSSYVDGISLAETWLNSLVNTTSAYEAQFLMVQNHTALGTRDAQDVVYFTPTSPVPEPQAYAMLLAGLGLVGFIGNRRKKNSRHLAMSFA